MHKKSIITKTIQVGSSTLLSRLFGVVREVLTVRYLGAGAMSDAFVTAFKIPNSLRKIFAEGALSAALVPSLVTLVHKDRHAVNQLLSLAFLLFETIVLVLCAITMIFARQVIGVVAPGFSSDQIAYAVPFLQILMPFIFFVSSSAILAGALQAVHHFFVPAFSPVLLNIIFISGLVVGLWYNMPVEGLCYFILFGGFVQLVMHIIAYRRLGFSFTWFDVTTWVECKKVLIKFVPCLFSMSVSEISLFIDTSFASYLPKGSVSLLYYANRFMGIPLGVFAVALSTILLPYFSKVRMEEPHKLSFYLLESTKLVFWVTVPATIIMSFFADKIFYTIFHSDKFSLNQVMEARTILIAFLLGLFFFSLNKILMSMYYALHNTTIPAIIAVIATISNIIMNIIFMNYYGAVGLALATTISGIIQTVLFVWLLHAKFDFNIYGQKFLEFVKNFGTQMLVLFACAFVLYSSCLKFFTQAGQNIAYYALETVLFWCWVGPIIGTSFLMLYLTRKFFNVHIDFLD